MQLSRLNLLPDDKSALLLPERVLQFGTGVLLRALPDYFFHLAGQKGLWNGRVVVVKSTAGDASAFATQDHLYTLCVRGLVNGKAYEENIVSTAISRVLEAQTQWADILATAHQPDIDIIISNTTEVGITLEEDQVADLPPASFPGKLLAWLWDRWNYFKGSVDAGCIIIPTELVDHNGDQLREIICSKARQQQLGEPFIGWICSANHFCNSLVDRIVPGKPAREIHESIQQALGYEDQLLTMCEVFRLWAIEGDDKIKARLIFAGADPGVVITENIGPYKELKLRLLNGTHTYCCGPAFLSGFRITRDATTDQMFGAFMRKLMREEIGISIPYTIEAATIEGYAQQVLERFANPYIDHPWINITLQYSSKMRMRNLPLLEQWYKQRSTVPYMMATGFAGYILFTKPVKREGNNYFGVYQGQDYPIKDNKAELFYHWWQGLDADELVDAVLGSEELWGKDLRTFPGFQQSVTQILKGMVAQGAFQTIQHMINR